jgi:DNA replication protein
MAAFEGFPSKSSRQTPIPNLFFTAVLPLIDDVVELKVALHLFWKLSWKKGYPRFVTLNELTGDLDLMSGLALEGRDPSQELARGLEQVVARGAYLHLGLERADSTEHLYFLNTDVDRRAIARIKRGEVDLGALPKVAAVTQPPEQRNIYGLYEENIGVLTPLIIEELKEAEELYPYPWIVEAFREAVRLNRRSWRYVQRILENWTAEGQPSGKHQRHPEEVPGGRQPPSSPGGYLVKRRRP